MRIGMGYEPDITIVVNGTKIPDHGILQVAKAIVAIGNAEWKLCMLVGRIDEANYREPPI